MNGVGYVEGHGKNMEQRQADFTNVTNIITARQKNLMKRSLTPERRQSGTCSISTDTKHTETHR